MSSNNFAEALRVQGRVILALMLREARTRYGRTKAGYLWALVEPCLHIGVFSLIYSSRLVIIPLGQSIVVFLATGFAVFLGFRNVMMRTMGGYGSNEALLSFPVVKVLDVFLGRAFLELATWVTITLLIFGSLIIAGLARFPYDILKMLGAIAALFTLAFGAGLFTGILSEFWASFRNILSMPLRLLYFISAVFYLPDSMPPTVREILAWNPVMHAITLFREGYYEGYQSHLLSVNYLAAWSVGAVFCGLVAEKVARKTMRSMAI